MPSLVVGGALVCAALGASPPGNPRQSPSPVGEARQLLLVITDGWDAVGGTIRRFERVDPSGAWRPAGPATPVAVGRAGLAWGRGRHPDQATDPVKREGDGKAPAGVFSLGPAFGFRPGPLSGWHLPYRPLANNVECVDTPESASYNRLVARTDVPRVDWSSSERMWAEPLYKWGVVVEHNTAPVHPGGGSCIFLHIWRGPGHGTAGCTAMDEAALVGIIGWLEPAKHAVLVQLPRLEYERLARDWQLPLPPR